MKLHPLEVIAKRHYGVTRDLHETGFILSDGTFLDLSGGVRGLKTRAHSALPDEIRRALGKSGHSGLTAFLQQTGAIRVLPAFGIEVGRMPTVEAIAALVAGWKRAFGDDSVIVDITMPDGTLVNQEIEDPEVDTLVEFMDSHFNSPSMGAAGNVVPPLFHGTLVEHLPAILEHGIERGEGWGGAGTSGAFLSGSLEGALYWAKIAYQREHGEKVEPERFDRVHGHEADQLIAVVAVQVPDDQVDRLRADEEQFEDVGADFPPDDWRQSLEKIGDVRFDGEIPPEWIVEVIPPARSGASA